MCVCVSVTLITVLITVFTRKEPEFIILFFSHQNHMDLIFMRLLSPALDVSVIVAVEKNFCHFVLMTKGLAAI